MYSWWTLSSSLHRSSSSSCCVLVSSHMTRTFVVSSPSTRLAHCQKPFFPEVLLLLRPKTQFHEILSSCTAVTKQCVYIVPPAAAALFVQSPYQLPLRVHVYSTRKVHALRMTNKLLSKERLSLRYQPTELQYKLPEK